MTVEELKAQLEGALQSIKSYVDAKDGALGGQIQDLSDQIEGMSELDPETIAQIQDLLENVDAETIALISKNNTRLNNVIDGLGNLKSYADNLFSLS